MPLEQIRNLTLWDAIFAVVDIGVVAYVLYRFFLLIRGTRAVSLINGLIVLLMVFVVSRWLRLFTVTWILQQGALALTVALPVVFQPELRRTLEQIGRGRLFAKTLVSLADVDPGKLIDEVVKATQILSRNKIGALIIVERETGLNEIIETGIKIEGLVSSEFLTNIFIPKTPLHDGAAVIRGNRVMAAGAFLPLTEQAGLSSELGTRHRAALGISEHSDAVAVVVSEETGTISVANAGKLIRHLDDRTLREVLAALIQAKAPPTISFWHRGSA